MPLFQLPSQEISELEGKIRTYSQAYYDSNPVISDQEFDKLVERLRKLSPDNPLLKTTSTGYKNLDAHLQKVKHPFFVGSLDKLKWEDIQKGDRWNQNGKLVASIKVDGGSGTAHYDEQGNLVRVLSRGDGEEGLDITQNCVNVPRMIVATGQPEVIRGELAISWEDFEEMDGSHPRNKSCGLSQSIHNDPKEISKIRFVAYHIFNWDSTKLDMLHALETQKFEVVPYTVFEGFDDFAKAVREGAYNVAHENIMKDGHHIPCDGTVLTVNEDPETQIAVKFAEESAWTTIKEFEWTISRTGRAVPVAILEPVNLAGAMIGRVTCNNFKWLKGMRIYPGVRVQIVRANEIIPQIISVESELGEMDYESFQWIPKVCPVCGEKLVTIGQDLSCQNDACDSRVMAFINRVFMNYAVDGIGETIAYRFYEIYRIKDLVSLKLALFEASRERLEVEFGPSTADKLMQMFEKLLTASPYTGSYLYMACIPRFGETAAEKFNTGVSAEEFRKGVNSPDSGIYQGIWSHYAFSYLQFSSRDLLKRYWHRLQELYDFFDGRVSQKVIEEKPKTQVKFSLTGSLSKTRDEFVAEMVKHGCEFVSTSKAEVFIANSKSTSSKYQEAVKKGIPIVTEEEFRQRYLS
jgi:DNA ligase (NAD+)